MHHRVDIQEDIKCYQDTLNHASSKVDNTLVQSLQKVEGRKGSVWKMKKDGNVGEGRKRLLSTALAIVALGQSGASGQDFVRDSIGGKFNEIDNATVCQRRCTEKVS